MAPTTDPLGDAITVLENVCIQDPSARPDTEDALSRVVTAVGYLRIASEIMRSLAKDNYVQAVIRKLSDYDRAELLEARKVVGAVRAWTDESTPETRLALHVALEEYDLSVRALLPRAEPDHTLACPQFSRHDPHEWEGEIGPVRCPGRAP